MRGAPRRHSSEEQDCRNGNRKRERECPHIEPGIESGAAGKAAAGYIESAVELCAAGRIKVRDDDACAITAERQGRRAANARRGARHQRDFALKRPH